MNKQLRYLMIKSAAQRVQSKKRQRRIDKQFELEVKKIEGEVNGFQK